MSPTTKSTGSCISAVTEAFSGLLCGINSRSYARPGDEDSQTVSHVGDATRIARDSSYCASRLNGQQEERLPIRSAFDWNYGLRRNSRAGPLGSRTHFLPETLPSEFLPSEWNIDHRRQLRKEIHDLTRTHSAAVGGGATPNDGDDVITRSEQEALPSAVLGPSTQLYEPFIRVYGTAFDRAIALLPPEPTSSTPCLRCKSGSPTEAASGGDCSIKGTQFCRAYLSEAANEFVADHFTERATEIANLEATSRRELAEQNDKALAGGGRGYVEIRPDGSIQMGIDTPEYTDTLTRRRGLMRTRDFTWSDGNGNGGTVSPTSHCEARIDEKSSRDFEAPPSYGDACASGPPVS